MSLDNTNNRNNYIGNDSTAQYGYSFRIFIDDDVRVIVTDLDDVETVLVKGTDYSVQGAGGDNGTITLIDAGQDFMSSNSFLETDYKLTLRRVLTLDQNTDIRNQGDFYAEAHEDEYDRSRMIDQQQQDEIDRSVKLPESIDPSTFDTELDPDIVGTADATIVTNSTGDGFAIGPTTTQIANAEASATAAAASAAAALVSENNASTSEDLAEDWATKTDGTVDGVEYSAKYYAEQVADAVGLEFDQVEFGLQNGGSSIPFNGLVIDPSDYTAFSATYDIFRRDDTQSVKEVGIVFFSYNNETATWDTPSFESYFGDAGLDFEIDASGLIRYTTTTFAGANHSGMIRFKDLTYFSQITEASDLDIANGTTGQSVPGALYDKSAVASVRMSIDIFRRDDTQSVKETGILYLNVDEENDVWSVPVLTTHFGSAGITFSMSAGGQLLVDSTTFAGANYSGTLRVRDIIIINQ